MAFSTKLTKAQLRSLVRQELRDPQARWWSDAEINNYLDDWQNELQHAFNFVWATSEQTLDATDLPLTLPTDMHRLDAAYWDNGNGAQRLAGLSVDRLNLLDEDWRNALPACPRATYQESPEQLNLYPPPNAEGTLTMEYPKVLSFASDSAAMAVPAWTKYSAINYCVMRAYARVGPNQNLRAAARRKKRWDWQLKLFRLILDGILPTMYPRLRPGSRYEAGMQNSWR